MTAKRFYYGSIIVGMLVSVWLIGYSMGRDYGPPRCTHGASSIGPVSIEGGKVTNQPKPHPERLPKGCKP